jgi:uncharacterized membrane protein YfcA
MLGVIAGFFSGLVGIGGGVIIVPGLVLLFGFDQRLAQGTTLALLVPPIGLLAVISYFQKGFVDVRSAFLICIGFILGGLIGGKIAVGLSEQLLKRIFAVLLIMLGVKMLLFNQSEY